MIFFQNLHQNILVGRRQLDRPPSIVDEEEATNEIPSSFVSDAINPFCAYQASRWAQPEIFSIPVLLACIDWSQTHFMSALIFGHKE